MKWSFAAARCCVFASLPASSAPAVCRPERRHGWNQLEALCQAHPYAINYGPVRPSTPRMIGLPPDYPDPKWKPRPKDLDLD